MTIEEIKKEFTKEFGGVYAYLPIWDWIKRKLIEAKTKGQIDECNYWINKMTIPNDIKFRNRIKELKESL